MWEEERLAEMLEQAGIATPEQAETLKTLLAEEAERKWGPMRDQMAADRPMHDHLRASRRHPR